MLVVSMSKLNVSWTCPNCGLVLDIHSLDIAAAHMWEEHGKLIEFHLNGERIIGGPTNSIIRWVIKVLS